MLDSFLNLSGRIRRIRENGNLYSSNRDSFESFMNRYYYLALIVLFFGLSASCWLGYHMIGSTVDENGLLVEVFALIPLAWFFLLLGLITGFYLIWKNRRP